MFCLPASLFAGGFKLALQGTKQLGMGHTGIGYAQDAATIYFNPAGMSFISDQVNGSVNLLLPSTSFLEKNTNQLTDANKKGYTPFSFYGKKHLGNRLNIGLGIYTPFGAGMHYPTGWTGRFVLTDISLSTLYIQPTLSYKLTDKLSVGAAYIFSYGSFSLEKDLPIQSISSPELYGHAQLKGSAQSSGYQVGVYYQEKDKFSVGLTYHSSVRLKVNDGDVYFSNIPQALYSEFPLNETFKSTLPLPAELGAGFSYQLTKQITAAFDINYTFWQVYDSLSFDYSNNTSTLTDSHSPRLYQNALAFRAGLSMNLPKHITFRVGGFFDQTPTQNGYVGPELPDNNKVGLTTGLTYSYRDHLTLDVAMLYEDVMKRNELNLESNLNGTYKTKVFCPSIGLNYIFQPTKNKK